MADPTDPILTAIARYRAGLKDYDANAPQDDAGAKAYIHVSYAPPMRVLEAWTEPAVSVDGAVEALRLARDENETGDSDIVGAMLSAALAYFETGGDQ